MTNEELVCRIQANEGREECLRELCDTNKPLIFYIVNRYSTDPEEQQDLIQQGYVGLIEAVERYDPDAGAKFSTWATFWIRSEVLSFLYGGAVHVSRELRDMINRIRRFETDFERDHGHRPTTNEVSGALDLSPDQVTRARAAASVLSVRSLSEVIDDDDLELWETIGDGAPGPEDVIIDQEGRRALWEMVDALDPLEADVIRTRYQDNKTRASCAEAMELSPSQVGVIEQRALGKLERKKWRLESFYDEFIFNNVFRHTGYGFFNQTWTSEQEWIVMQKEKDCR